MNGISLNLFVPMEISYMANNTCSELLLRHCCIHNMLHNICLVEEFCKINYFSPMGQFQLYKWYLETEITEHCGNQWGFGENQNNEEVLEFGRTVEIILELCLLVSQGMRAALHSAACCNLIIGAA